MTQKIFRSKRGEDMIVDFWAILVFAVIAVLFFFIFSVSAKADEKNLKAQFETKDANVMLQAFLRAPAIGIDNSMTVADIIAQDVAMDNYDRSSKLFHDFFRRVYVFDSNWVSHISISIDGHTEKIKSEQKIRMGLPTTAGGMPDLVQIAAHVIKENEHAYATIPGYEKRIYVSLHIRHDKDASEGAITDTK